MRSEVVRPRAILMILLLILAWSIQPQGSRSHVGVNMTAAQPGMQRITEDLVRPLELAAARPVLRRRVSFHIVRLSCVGASTLKRNAYG